MRRHQGSVWGGALGLLVAAAGTGHAAWDNVFQVCCNSCGGYAPSVSNAPPDPYGHPGRSYYEPVTTYRYSYYYDPCSDSYQQVAVPTTSYRLRSQCCPVTSYLQRCCQGPVTSYQQAGSWEPVTPCYGGNPCGSCGSCGPCSSSYPRPAAVRASTAAPGRRRQGAPGVDTFRDSRKPKNFDPDRLQPIPEDGTRQTPGAPGVDTFRDSSNRKDFDPYRPQPVPGAVPPGSNRPGAPQPARTPVAPAAPPEVRLDRIVSQSGPGVDGQGVRSDRDRTPLTPRSPAAAVLPPQVRMDRIEPLPGTGVEGQVVLGDRRPQPGAKVLFVNRERQEVQQTVVTDRAGRFQAHLAWGTWLVYVSDTQSRPVLHGRLEVRDKTRHITLVSR